MRIQISLSEDDDHRVVLERTGFWGLQAAGAIFLSRSTGRLMLAHRSSRVLEPNTWGTWGGAVNRRETPVQACLREVKEETGYNGRVKLLPMLVFEHSSGFKYYNYLAVVPKEFDPKLNEETQGFKWVRLGEWPSPLHKGVTLLLRDKNSMDLIQRVIDGENI